MAFIVPHRGGSWELRTSEATPAGPRSRTLATFRVLTPEVLDRARTRSPRPLDDDAVRKAARRAGAPVAPTPADGAAGMLLSELAAGRPPRPLLRRLLRDALDGERGGVSDAARAAAAWISASSRQRGEALWDLLLLADRLPPPRAAPRDGNRFPHVESRAA